MSVITNSHRSELALPGGTVLPPGIPTPVHDWDKIKNNHVVQAWIKAGILKVEGAPAGDQGSQFTQPSREELQAKLDALGVPYDKRSGVAKLQTLLAEAEAKKQKDILYGSDVLPANIDIADGRSVQLGEVVAAAHDASALSVEEWNALPADEREALLAAQIEKLKAEAAKG